jgi:hypothetical protein
VLVLIGLPHGRYTLLVTMTERHGKRRVRRTISV